MDGFQEKEYATNCKLVKRVRDVADIMDIETMKAEELRKILDLEKKVIW